MRLKGRSDKAGMRVNRMAVPDISLSVGVGFFMGMGILRDWNGTKMN